MEDDDNEKIQVYLLGKTYLGGKQEQFFIKNDPIVQMAAGDMHTIVLTKSGRAFAFGENKFGQLGLGHTNSVEKVSCIKSLKFTDSDEKLILITCGRDASLVATNRGSLYVFGSNSRSQLGIDSDEAIQSTPVKIESIRGKNRWKQIAMGSEHACALTEDGKIYVWGANDDGQCGLPRKKDTIRIPTELRVDDYQIDSIACGYYTTGLVSAEGRLFLFGNNQDRQLGRSTPERHVGPLEVSLNEKVKAVSLGNQHTVVLTEKGKVYTCGNGSRGQLGLGQRIRTAEAFELVDTLPKDITAISAGEAHTAVIGKRGDLYVFGDGKHGKLGSTSTTYSNEFQPCGVDKFKTYYVQQVVCGGCQTIVLARKKRDNELGASDSEEDIGNQTLSATQRSRSRARQLRSRVTDDHTHASKDSMDSARQNAQPLGATGHLRTETDDSEKSDKELSASMRSATFNQTHTLTNGKLRPTQPPSLDRNTLRSTDSVLKPLRTGALDRTVRLQKDTTDRSPSHDNRRSRSNSPSTKKKQDSDDDSSSPRTQRSNRPNVSKKDSDDDSSPVRNKTSDHRNPPAIKKRDDSNDAKSSPRNPRFNYPNREIKRQTQDSDDDDSSSNGRRNQVTSNRNVPPSQPRSQYKSDSSDDSSRKPSPTTKSAASEKLNRKKPQRSDSDDEHDDDKKLTGRSTKQPAVGRRNSLQNTTSSRDGGNQTIGPKRNETIRGSVRGAATSSLAKTNSKNETPKKDSQPPAQQPGFFARLFGSKSAQPATPAPTKQAPPANQTSRACTIA